MAYDKDNVFAKILCGEIPCDKIYEDDYAIAFHDIEPQTPIHILVIPKGAYVSIADFGQNADENEITGFWRAVSKIAHEHGLMENGFRSVANTGVHGGQEVPHFHVHLLGGAKIGPLVQKGK